MTTERTTERTIEVETADGAMRVYESVPDADPRGAVIVAQEAFGVNDHIQDVTRRFAAQGFRAVAPTFFHRAGGGVAPYDDFTKVMPLFEGVDADGVLADVDATLEHLRTAGFADDEVGIVGFCFGGAVAFLVAARRDVGASVSFYGGGITEGGRGMLGALHVEAPALRAPWLGLFGDRDTFVPVEGVEKLRRAVSEATPPTEVVRYADAGHGFHCDAREDYHEPSAQDGWRRTIDWLDRHLGRR